MASDGDDAGAPARVDDKDYVALTRRAWRFAKAGDVREFALTIERLKQLRADFDDHAMEPFGAYFTWMATAAQAGRLEIVRLLVNMDVCEMDDWIMTCLARSGHVHILQWAMERGLGHNGDIICEEAARNGRLNVLEFARFDHDCYWDENTPRLAALGGHSQCLKFAYENGCKFSEEVTAAAVQGGKLNCLRYLHEVCRCPWDENSCIEAAETGQLRCLRYLHEHGCEWSEDTFSTAARAGQMEVVKYLQENECPWSEEVCIEAASEGHLDVLKFLVEHGCDWGARTTEAAAQCSVDCLRYAHENGQCIDYAACRSAMEFGDLRCLEYVYEHARRLFEDNYASLCLQAALAGSLEGLKFSIERLGVPTGDEWEKDTCAAAAQGGHLACLQYLHKQRCPLTATVCCKAVEEGHLDCLAFAIENDCPIYEERVLELAARKGHLDCLQLVHKHVGHIESGIMNQAAGNENDDVDCVQYLHEQGVEWDEDTCVAAAIAGNAYVLEYLHEHGCPWDTRVLASDSETCRDFALENGVLGDIEDVLRAKLPGTEFEDNLRKVMRVIDEVKTSIPEGKYLEICSALQSAFSELRTLE